MGKARSRADGDYKTDNAVVDFGADGDVTLTHDPDDGLILKSKATADDNPVLLTLQTGETDLAANDVIGKIAFQAPDEGTGTDAILVSAAIQARAEGDHSSSSNATSLDFMTGASEAATTKMVIDSAGAVGIGTSLTPNNNSNYQVLTIGGGAATTGAAIELEDSSGNIDASLYATAGQVALASDPSNGQGSSLISMQVDGTARMTIGSGGDVDIETGDIFFSTADKGICLGATSATAANTLHDYEEGTFTPRLHGATTGNSTAASQIDANSTVDYYKIGSVVFCGVYFSNQQTSSQMSGQLMVSGFPFTANGTYMTSSSQARAMGLPNNDAAFQFTGSVAGNTTVGFVNQADNGSWASTDSADAVPNTTAIYFRFTITYGTDS